MQKSIESLQRMSLLKKTELLKWISGYFDLETRLCFRSGYEPKAPPELIEEESVEEIIAPPVNKFIPEVHVQPGSLDLLGYRSIEHRQSLILRLFER